jgi:hypothetical protein
MSYGTIKSELVAREGGETYAVDSGYELKPLHTDTATASVSDLYIEWLVPGQNIPDGDYTRQPHRLRRAERVHVTDRRMRPGWLMVEALSGELKSRPDVPSGPASSRLGL